jgi:protein TonB
MEIKKSTQASLENKRLLFAETGLVIALAAVFGLIEWSSASRPLTLLEDTTRIVEEDDILAIELEMPQPPPAAPEIPVLSDLLDIVDDNIEVDYDFVDLTEENGQEITIVSYIDTPVVEEEDEDETIPMVLVETKPTFNGGDANDFSKWVNARLVYPERAREMGVQGRVTLQFTIGTDGKVFDVKVLKGADPLLDQEAMRVVASSPRWSPGKQRDRAVKVSYTFPVVFRLK